MALQMQHPCVDRNILGLVKVFIFVLLFLLFVPEIQMNKTKYFRLRLSDKVGTERPETDLRLTQACLR